LHLAFEAALLLGLKKRRQADEDKPLWLSTSIRQAQDTHVVQCFRLARPRDVLAYLGASSQVTRGYRRNSLLGTLCAYPSGNTRPASTGKHNDCVYSETGANRGLVAIPVRIDLRSARQGRAP
jgi:hypothetical protein